LIRKRGVKSAAALLRLIFLYVCGTSFLELTHLARVLGLAKTSDVALNKRLRKTAGWLAYLIGQVLALGHTALQQAAGLRIRLIDGTTVRRPGVTGTDWRVHVSLDLITACVDDVTLTYRGGESFAAMAIAPNDLLVGDRAYGTRPSIQSAVQREGHVLVRFAYTNLPLQTPDGLKFDPLAAARSIPADQDAQEWAVQTAPTKQAPAVDGRVIIARLPAQTDARAQKRLTRRSQKQGSRIRAATREAARYLFLFTTLPAAQYPLATCLAIFRLRWQVELAIKRLKSELGLEDLRAKTDALCRTVLLAKLLLALLLERFGQQQKLFPPSDGGGDAAQSGPGGPGALSQYHLCDSGHAIVAGVAHRAA
jgi:hypothetical protein